MNVTTIGAALLALAVVATGAAAAAPGNAPVDVPTTEHGEQATQHEAETGNATDATGDERSQQAERERAQAMAGHGEADQRGPPVDLPSQVPDFVGEIHDLIRQHVSGALEGILGHQVSDVTPDDGATAAGQAANATQA